GQGRDFISNFLGDFRTPVEHLFDPIFGLVGKVFHRLPSVVISPSQFPTQLLSALRSQQQPDQCACSQPNQQECYCCADASAALGRFIFSAPHKKSFRVIRSVCFDSPSAILAARMPTYGSKFDSTPPSQPCSANYGHAFPFPFRPV